MNTVAIVGILERDPIVRFRPEDGQQIVSLTLRIEEPNRHGQRYRTFVPIEVYGGLVEQAEALQPGQLISLTGKLGWKSFEKEGRKQTTVCVVARQIEVLNPAPEAAVPARGDDPTRPAGW